MICLNKREEIKAKMLQAILKNTLQVDRKADNSIVTQIDLLVSDLVKASLEGEFGDKFNFYSEEDHGAFKYPMSILDPIDGTIELVEGNGECALSLAIMESEIISCSKNWGWIYNPFTSMDLTSSDKRPHSTKAKKGDHRLLGLVSNSEWKKGLYSNSSNNCVSQQYINLHPVGSIANKLGLLSIKSCDFVVTLVKKNVWDIAAGTIIANRMGFYLWDKYGKVEKLDREIFEAPLLWAREEDVENIKRDMKGIF